MTKKLLTALVATLITLPISAKAAEPTTRQPETIAIIDTALDTSLSLFKDRIAYEVCIVEFESCPNGKPIMEGPGSAVLPFEIISKYGLDHGTQMASLAVKENMTVKIVFIRIAGINPRLGVPKPRTDKTVNMALDWVIANQSKFNIQAVSMSQSAYNVSKPMLPFFMSAPETDYCPKFPETESRINKLVSLGVPSFFPAGNDRDYKRIAWPACIQSSMSIGASITYMGTNTRQTYHEMASISNLDPRYIDFFAPGMAISAMGPNNVIKNIVGTSASTVIAATNWVTIKSAKPELTYSQVYDLISRTSTPIKTFNQTYSGKFIDVVKALNG